MKFVKSPYFSRRGSFKPRLIVIHTTVGGYQSTIRYFQNNSRRVSAHYVISLDGDITQMVDESRAAHHAGNILNPKNKLVRVNMGNPNYYSIGIENADDRRPYDADRSKQLPQLAKLVREIADRYDIPLTRDHVCGHNEIYSAKGCPGNIDVDTVLQMSIKGVPVANNKLAEKMQELMDRYSKGSPEDFDKFLIDHVGENGQGGFLASQRMFQIDLADELALPRDSSKDLILKRVETLIQELKEKSNNPSIPDFPMPDPGSLVVNGVEVEVQEGKKNKVRINYAVRK